jgi:hypothetical protein
VKNALLAMIPAHCLPIEKGQDVSKAYRPGHELRARVASVYGDKINCSVRADQDSVLKLCLKITFTMIDIGHDDVKVSLPSKYEKFNAVIPNGHFSDFLPLSLHIGDALQIGRKLHNCILVRFPGTSAPAVLTRKLCYREFIEDPLVWVDGIEVGQSYFGYVSGVQSCGSFVTVYGGVSGLITVKVLSVGYSVHPAIAKVENCQIGLKLGTEAGESVFFLQNYMKDCRDFAPSFVIRDELTFEHSPERIDDVFVYSITDEWKGISRISLEKQRIAYLDVVSKTAVFNKQKESNR